MCVRQMRPPGRGDFWILKIAHAPSPKSLSKNGFCPKKGVAFLTEDGFEKNFQVWERIPLSALAPARRAAAVGRKRGVVLTRFDCGQARPDRWRVK
jgi:hypothetical protein